MINYKGDLKSVQRNNNRENLITVQRNKYRDLKTMQRNNYRKDPKTVPHKTTETI